MSGSSGKSDNEKKDERKDKDKKDEERKGSSSKDTREPEKKEKHVHWAEGTKKAGIGFGKKAERSKRGRCGGCRKSRRDGRDGAKSGGAKVEKEREPNGWVNFCREKGREPKFKNKPVTELTKALSKDWRELPDEEKQDWKWSDSKKPDGKKRDGKK